MDRILGTAYKAHMSGHFSVHFRALATSGTCRHDSCHVMAMVESNPRRRYGNPGAVTHFVGSTRRHSPGTSLHMAGDDVGNLPHFLPMGGLRQIIALHNDLATPPPKRAGAISWTRSWRTERGIAISRHEATETASCENRNSFCPHHLCPLPPLSPGPRYNKDSVRRRRAREHPRPTPLHARAGSAVRPAPDGRGARLRARDKSKPSRGGRVQPTSTMTR
jgi:hypothetical protein